ncbi:hypothetical protein [uncultured Eubacterium sp.]|uniref:hypothetical protein n=1 Tax=uncultured Eubacterium sp. TaxID=165185 RepID=UPI0025D01CBD|nr:hypothetical protein [uncultured Eubacterium sp.]
MKKSKAQNKNKPKGAIYPYLYRTVSFVLLSLLLFAPLMMVGLDEAKNTVRDAQSYLKMDYNDLQIGKVESNKTGEDFIDDIEIGTLLGTISCERIGFNENVYYGYNRVSMRNGGGLDSRSYLFGMGGVTKIAGYSSDFGSLYNVKKGDIIEVQSNLGNFKYKVYKAELSETADDAKDNSLILGTTKSNEAFSSLAGEYYYVYASLIDGEVQ